MKTLSEQQINELSSELEELNLETLKTGLGGYYAAEVAPGDVWTGLSVEKTDSLHNFQKQVLELSKKYESQERTPDTYAIDDFYEEKEIKFFEEDEYLAREGLHITLGKQDIQKQYDAMNLPEKVTFDKLVIGKIGNYGSVREILFEIALK